MSFTENPQKDTYVVADDSLCTKNYDKHWKTCTYVVDNTRNNRCDLLNYPYKGTYAQGMYVTDVRLIDLNYLYKGTYGQGTYVTDVHDVRLQGYIRR